MYRVNANRILEQLRPDDVVLDIGGWACPFNRANYVLDSESYESRGFYRTFGMPGSQGGEREHFTRKTWIQRDICEKTPYPFEDKSIDFVICSHTLEDLRDPIFVCSEMKRIGKRGYIEVPSRLAETCRGNEQSNMAGLSHHRWLVTISDNHIEFVQKFHSIHHWRNSLPSSFLRSLSDEDQIECLFWEEKFTFEERFIHGLQAQSQYLQAFVDQVYPRAQWMLALDRWYRISESYFRRAQRKALQLLPGAFTVIIN